MNDQASPALPPVVDRNAWQAAREALRALIAYFHALWPGLPAAEQCEGCTFFNSQVCELSYIHSRNVTYAVLCKGAYEEASATETSSDCRCPGTRPRRRRPNSWSVATGSGTTSCAPPRRRPGVRDLLHQRRGVEIMAPTHGRST
jgi:hypothetical protein